MGKSGFNGLGPGYADVADTLISISREYGGLHEFTITADRNSRGDSCLFVVLKHRDAFSVDGERNTVRAWSRWPCAANSTFSGLLFRLCFELSEKLERRKVTREVQTGF